MYQPNRNLLRVYLSCGVLPLISTQKREKRSVQFYPTHPVDQVVYLPDQEVERHKEAEKHDEDPSIPGEDDYIAPETGHSPFGLVDDQGPLIHDDPDREVHHLRPLNVQGQRERKVHFLPVCIVPNARGTKM